MMSLVLFFFFTFFFLILRRLSFKIFNLTNFSSFFFWFKEFMVILFKVCVPFMIILHGKENKVYGGREMERKMDLSNFMYARLYDASKDMITNKFYFFIQSTNLTKEYFIRIFSHFLIFHKKDSKNFVIKKVGNNLNLL